MPRKGIRVFLASTVCDRPYHTARRNRQRNRKQFHEIDNAKGKIQALHVRI